jgi:hypothetical protein
MTYDQALGIVKCAMKNGQTVGVSWDEIEEEYLILLRDDGLSGPVDSFELAIGQLATDRKVGR